MQSLTTVLAVICLTLSAVTMANPTPQGFISQEKCANTGSYGCGTSNNIVCFSFIFCVRLLLMEAQ